MFLLLPQDSLSTAVGAEFSRVTNIIGVPPIKRVLWSLGGASSLAFARSMPTPCPPDSTRLTHSFPILVNSPTGRAIINR